MKLHKLVSSHSYKLLIELEDFDGEKRYAEYEVFRIGDATTNYRLTVEGHSGTLGNYNDTVI